MSKQPKFAWAEKSVSTTVRLSERQLAALERELEWYERRRRRELKLSLAELTS